MLNMALEKQAIGRVHRLGQKRPVKASVIIFFMFALNIRGCIVCFVAMINVI